MDQSVLKEKIIFFDGTCILCNAFAEFIIRADRRRRLKLGTLQSGFAHDLLRDHMAEHVHADSVIFFDEGEIYIKSAAILRIAGHLGFPASMLKFLHILPRQLRDSIYDLVARKRYGWFGKRETCRVPDKESAGRFIA